MYRKRKRRIPGDGIILHAVSAMIPKASAARNFITPKDAGAMAVKE
jgi:hypothetical protein